MKGRVQVEEEAGEYAFLFFIFIFRYKVPVSTKGLIA